MESSGGNAKRIGAEKHRFFEFKNNEEKNQIFKEELHAKRELEERANALRQLKL